VPPIFGTNSGGGRRGRWPRVAGATRSYPEWKLGDSYRKTQFFAHLLEAPQSFSPQPAKVVVVDWPKILSFDRKRRSRCGLTLRGRYRSIVVEGDSELLPICLWLIARRIEL